MLFLWLLPEPALVSGTNQARGGRTRTRRQKALSLRVAIFIEKRLLKKVFPAFRGLYQSGCLFHRKSLLKKGSPGKPGDIPRKESDEK